MMISVGEYFILYNPTYNSADKDIAGKSVERTSSKSSLVATASLLSASQELTDFVITFSAYK